MKDVNPGISFTLAPAFFDISQTKQISGKEDLIGKDNVDLPWYEEGMEDERASLIYSSLLEFASEHGIKVNTVDDIGGARGVSRSGSIDILNNSGKDVGLTKTLAHEIAHEILHQQYLKTRDPKMKEYFVGSNEGRSKVEQQAEVCAWIIMKNFGFDLRTSINYIGMWGADDKSVVKVFDQVAKVANLLIEYAENKMKTVRTEAIGERDGATVTGLDIADLLGLGDLYKKYEESGQIRESFYKTLNKIS